MVVSPHIGRAFAIGGIGFMVLGLLCYAAGLRVNTTRSIPVGLYWMTGEAVARGQYVLFCPPQTLLFEEAKRRGYIGAGFCPGNYGYMMKRVLAAADDRVVIAGEGVSINGKLLPASEPLKADKAGRAMPHIPSGTYTLAKSELLLMSDGSPTSFDGRYFGAVDASQVKGVIQPLLIW